MAQIQRQKATWETISSLLGGRGGCAAIMCQLGCIDYTGCTPLTLAWQVVQLLCAVMTSTSFLLYKLHIQNDLDNTWQISWHPVVSVSGGPALPYGECRNTVCPTLSVCLSSAGMGLLRIALGRCLHRALFGAQGQCNPIIFLYRRWRGEAGGHISWLDTQTVLIHKKVRKGHLGKTIFVWDNAKTEWQEFQ